MCDHCTALTFADLRLRSMSMCAMYFALGANSIHLAGHTVVEPCPMVMRKSQSSTA